MGERSLQVIGREFETARLGLGVSQEHVAEASHVSRPRYSKIENGKAPTLQVLEVARIASVLGLDSSIRLFPGALAVRDAAHARRLGGFLAHAAPPLRVRTEAALPALPDRRELRAWDAMIVDGDARTAVELEMRLHDTQALERRLSLKRRDDPTTCFLLLIADTRMNRRVLASLPDLFPDLPASPRLESTSAWKVGCTPRPGWSWSRASSKTARPPTRQARGSGFGQGCRSCR